MKLSRSSRAHLALALVALTGPLVSGNTGAAAAPQMPTLEELQRRYIERTGRGTQERQATATRDGVQVVFQSGHAQDITATAISPDGRLILTGSSDGTAKLWNVASGQELRTFSGFDLAGPQGLGFSSDSARAYLDDGLTLRYFDVQSGAKVGELSATFQQSAVSAGGRFVAARTGDRQARLAVTDTTNGNVLWTVPDKGVQYPVAISADGKLLVTYFMEITVSTIRSGNQKAQTQIWDVGSSKPRVTLPLNTTSGQAKLTPDGKFLLVLQPVERSIAVYDTSSGALLRTLAAAAAAYYLYGELAFSADGKLAAAAFPGSPATIWEIETGRTVAEVPATAISFTSDAHSVVLGVSGRGAPVIRELASGHETNLSGGIASVTGIAPLSDGSLVVAAMGLGAARVWDLSTGQLVRSLACPGGSATMTASVNPLSDEVATGCSDGSAWLWNVRSGELLHALAPPLVNEFAFTKVQYLPDGKRIVVGVKDRLSVRSMNGEEIGSIVLPQPKLPTEMTDPFAGLDEKTLKQMPAQTRAAIEQQKKLSDENSEQIQQMEQAAAWPQAFAIHPGGKLLAVARMYDLSVWDLESGRMTRMLSGAGAQAAAAAGRAPEEQDVAADMMRKIMTGGRLSRKDMKKMEKIMQEQGDGSGVYAPDPLETLGEVQDILVGGATYVVFDRNGRLLALSAGGKRMWDVVTGAKLEDPASKRRGLGAGMSPEDILDRMAQRDPLSETTAAAFSPDGRIGALAVGSAIRLWDVASGEEIVTLEGHTSDVRSLAFTSDGRQLLSGGNDGALRIWSLQTRTQTASLIALGDSDYVAVTPDQFYRASKSRIRGIAFRLDDAIYPFEQFDLRFNRPDILLERLGRAGPEAVQAYRTAYQRRLKKMGFDEQQLGTAMHLPVVEIQSKDIPVTTGEQQLMLKVRAVDDTIPLDRLNVYVNDVPVYGSAGLAIEGESNSLQRELSVPLVAGRNKIQVSALNRQGAESLKQTAYTNATGAFPPSDTYIVAIGVSQYRNAAYNLRYAAKDAGDLLAAYQAPDSIAKSHGTLHVLPLTNEQATRAEIRRAKEWLKQAKTGDLAVVFAAGHGMTDTQGNYYFGTHDIDPENPGANGLPYEDFEALLDGIAPLQKLLLIDTCFSGEIDKDEPVTVAGNSGSEAGTVTMRSFKAQRGIAVVADESGAAAGQSTGIVRFQQDWFADLRRGTGAAVISSASGNEYALEGEQWSNGVFTYALLQGLKNREADSNRDGVITVSELQAYVIDQVRALTQGGQNPTVRRENLDYDFAVY